MFFDERCFIWVIRVCPASGACKKKPDQTGPARGSSFGTEAVRSFSLLAVELRPVGTGWWVPPTHPQSRWVRGLSRDRGSEVSEGGEKSSAIEQAT